MDKWIVAMGLFASLCSPWARAGEGYDHDYGAMRTLLDGAVTDDGVRYDLLASRRSMLDAHLTQVAEAEVAAMTPEQQLALWVNAYNGYTLATILDAMPVASIRDLDGGKVWSTRRFVVGGASVTLDQMEHQHARKLADGRLHAVVNCASKGCPPLPPVPLTPTGLDAQLDRYAKRWVATNAVATEGNTLALSKIFDWYSGDFVRWRTVDHADANDAQDAALGFVETFGGPSLAPGAKVGWASYDWSLNKAR